MTKSFQILNSKVYFLLCIFAKCTRLTKFILSSFFNTKLDKFKLEFEQSYYKPGGQCKSLKSTRELLDFGSLIGSLWTLGNIIFDILEPTAVQKYNMCWYSWHFNKAVFVYLTVGHLGISFLTSLNQQLFRNIAYVWYSWHFNKAVFVYLYLYLCI